MLKLMYFTTCVYIIYNIFRGRYICNIWTDYSWLVW